MCKIAGDKSPYHSLTGFMESAREGTIADVKRLLFYIPFCLSAAIACAGAQKEHRPEASPKLTTVRDLSKYVGTFPCNNGLLNQPVLLQTLRKILGSDYQAYRDHMKASGCGSIRRQDGFLLLDVSQLHVGGYTSLMYVRERDGALYLFWLKSTVRDRDYAFYGVRPIPKEVSRQVESQLNEMWGHVAKFTVSGDRMDIHLNK